MNNTPAAKPANTANGGDGGWGAVGGAGGSGIVILSYTIFLARRRIRNFIEKRQGFAY